MKKLIFLAPLLLTLFVQPSFAKKAVAKKDVVKKEQAAKPKLGTSFSFDGSSLRGKYQSALSTKAIVENDKMLEDLLGGRTKFDDKIKQDAKRN